MSFTNARVPARIACFATVVILGGALAYGAKYYVAPVGKGTNEGSKVIPWDFASAITAGKVKPGDTVWVGGGTYMGQFN